MLNPLSVIKLPVLLSLYFISSFAQAQSFSSAATAGSGGAGRAGVDAGDVNYLNPAALVHLKGRYLYSTASKEDLSVGLSETSREVVVPASLSYYQNNFENLAHQSVHIQDTRLSLADFMFEKASIGLTGIMNSSRLNEASYRQTNGNVGFFYTPTENFGLSYVFYNVFAEDSQVPEAIRLRSQMAAATNYVFRKFLRFRADVLSAANNDYGHSTYMAGIETFMNEFIMVRFGYATDTLVGRDLVTEGIGFRGPVFSVNYAHQGAVRGSDFDRHSIDLSISF